MTLLNQTVSAKLIKVATFTVLFFTNILLCSAQNVVKTDTKKVFPIPPVSKKLLFYVQRSVNTNTVMYEANLLPNGKLNPEKPVHVYWIKYEDQGKIKELNYLDRTLAYGVNCTADINDKYILNFVASSKKKPIVFMDKDGIPKAYLTINKTVCRLEKIFVQAVETSWLPKVDYVDLIGTDIKTGERLTERVYP